MQSIVALNNSALHAIALYFGVRHEAGEEPVEPAERQRAFALREGELLGWDVGVGGEGMEALHAGCVVNAKTLHNYSGGW